MKIAMGLALVLAVALPVTASASTSPRSLSRVSELGQILRDPERHRRGLIAHAELISGLSSDDGSSGLVSAVKLLLIHGAPERPMVDACALYQRFGIYLYSAHWVAYGTPAPVIREWLKKEGFVSLFTLDVWPLKGRAKEPSQLSARVLFWLRHHQTNQYDGSIQRLLELGSVARDVAVVLAKRHARRSFRKHPESRNIFEGTLYLLAAAGDSRLKRLAQIRPTDTHPLIVKYALSRVGSRAPDPLHSLAAWLLRRSGDHLGGAPHLTGDWSCEMVEAK